MDGFSEKKWFVYMGDHHEGPFSLDEIQGKLRQAEVSASTSSGPKACRTGRP
jgi:hypothetical protein